MYGHGMHMKEREDEHGLRLSQRGLTKELRIDMSKWVQAPFLSVQFTFQGNAHRGNVLLFSLLC